MKKNLFKVSLILSTISLLFSSCLGDTDSTYEASNDFTYVKRNSSDGVVYASLFAYAGLFATSPAIADLNPGSCYFMSYKLSTSNTQGAYYVAELVANPVPIPQSQGVLVLNEGESLPSQQNEIYPTSLAVSKGAPGEFLFEDRWLCSAKFKKALNDEISIKLYFDPNNQFEDLEKTKPVGANKMILDIALVKNYPSTQEETVQDYSFVANMSGMRSYIENIIMGSVTTSKPTIEMSEQDEAYVQYRFRYKKESSNVAEGYEVKLYPENSWSDNIRLYFNKQEMEL